MTLTIHREEDEQRQLTLKVEVAESRVQQAMKETARKLAKDIRVPGFRQGRAPYNVILRRFGAEAVRAEAVEELVPVIFEEVIAEADVAEDMYGQPSLMNMEMSPLSMEFIVPLSPMVTLGDYRAIRKEIEPIEIADAAVEEEIERIQNQHQKLETVERPAELGDVVTLQGTGVLTPLPKEEAATEEDEAAAEAEALVEEVEEEEETAVSDAESDAETATADDTDEDDYDEDDYDEDDEVIFDEARRDFLLDSRKVFSGTPFVENLVGLSAGEETEFSFVFPEDYEEESLVGREVTFQLSVLEVKLREVPAIDDELAKLNGRFETLDELREGIRKDLYEQAEQQAADDLSEAFVDDLLEDATMIYPPAAVELEISEMFNNLKQQVSTSGWDFNDFLRLQGQTEDDVRENFRESADKRLKRRLVMRQMILDEKITVAQEDIDAAVEQRIARFGDNEDIKRGMREYFTRGQGFEMLSGQILSDKINERVRAIVTGAAPDLAELVAETADEDEEE